MCNFNGFIQVNVFHDNQWALACGILEQKKKKKINKILDVN